MSRRLMSLICLGMYCLCLWLAVQTVEKVRQISPGVSLRYAQALTGEQVKKAQTYIKSSQNTVGAAATVTTFKSTTAAGWKHCTPTARPSASPPVSRCRPDKLSAMSDTLGGLRATTYIWK